MVHFRYLLIILMLATANSAVAAEQFDQASCRAIKGTVELFLGVADTNFKEAERLRQNGDETGADASFGEASDMSELAENYSAVHTAFSRP
jgi:hypothetical protein